MDHGHISKLAYLKFLASRRVHHIVESDRFKRAFDNSTQEEKDIIEKLINKGDYTNLKLMVSKILNKYLEHMPMRNLRAIGQQYGIKEYYVLTRNQLVERIRDAKKRYSENAS